MKEEQRIHLALLIINLERTKNPDPVQLKRLKEQFDRSFYVRPEELQKKKKERRNK